jgi:hypothetical protein
MSADVAWENSLVSFMCQRFGIPKPAVRQLLRMCQQQAPTARLRLEVFLDQFPDFPIYLGASRLRGILLPYTPARQVAATDGSAEVRDDGGEAPPPQDMTKRTKLDYRVSRDPYSTEVARFKKFQWVPFVVAFEQFRRENVEHGADRPLGLVYPRDGLQRGMVIHNDSSEKFWTSGYCEVYKFPGSDVRYYVQPFSVLIDAISDGGRGWRPNLEHF